MKKRISYKSEWEALKKIAIHELNSQSAEILKLELELIELRHEKMKNIRLRSQAEKLWWLIFDLCAYTHEKLKQSPEENTYNSPAFQYLRVKMDFALSIFSRDVDGIQLYTPEELKNKREAFQKMMSNINKQPTTTNQTTQQKAPKF